jgi:CRP-like cAMP-binding protein
MAPGIHRYQDEAGSSLFIVEEGLVNILLKDAEGSNTWVAYIQPGGFFGEMALLPGSPGLPQLRRKPR